MANSIDNVMSSSEIAERVSVDRRTVLNQCKRWAKKNLARKAGRYWVVDRQTALAYIEQHPKNKA